MLVVGSNDNGYEGNNTADTLRGLGLDVNRQSSLPADLSSYSSIWYVNAYSGLSSDDQVALEHYISDGGSAYLTGERPCCETLNASVQNVLRSVLNDQDVEVGGLGDIAGPFTFNGNADAHITDEPNLLVDFVPDSPGGMAGIGGVDGRNVFASNGSTPVGAVWTEQDMKSGIGRVALMMDIDWLGDSARQPIIENIQNFLDHGAVCSNDGPDDGFLWTGPTPSNSPANCSTLLTPTHVSWTAGSDHPPVSLTVDAQGVTADCTTTHGNPTTVSCDLSNATEGATLHVTGTDAVGSVTRHYRVRPMNDPRNVPPGQSADSHWWNWPDSDGDGIPDYWEQNGVYVKGRYLDLPGMGADPDHKDLFVHYDFEEGRVFDEQVFDDMRSAFAHAPLHNPGSDGLTLHIDEGGTVPSSVVGDFALDQADIQRVTTYTGFANSPKAGGGGVPQLFKWMLNFGSAGGSVIGTGLVKGDFAWTAFPIGSWEAALNLAGLTPGSAENFAQASNATHELGHLLGLRHHGADEFPTHDNRYKSVMSYSYSNFGLPSALGFGHRIDYSRTTDVHLDWQTGPAFGQIEFVPGQYGDQSDFYAANNSETIDTSEEQPAEPTAAEVVNSADPGSIQAFVDDFGLDAHPDVPTLANTEATVDAGHSVHIPLQASDPQGQPLTFVIDDGQTLGVAVPADDGLDYKAKAGVSGDDPLIVRATNGTLSSEQATITVHVVPTASVTNGSNAVPTETPSLGVTSKSNSSSKPKSPPHSRKRLTRHQKLARAIKACQKRKKSERARCVKRARRRYGRAKPKSTSHADKRPSRHQKLARAIKACEKRKHSEQAACIKRAERRYAGAKHT